MSKKGQEEEIWLANNCEMMLYFMWNTFIVSSVKHLNDFSFSKQITVWEMATLVDFCKEIKCAQTF
jgi:hypothetical protein